MSVRVPGRVSSISEASAGGKFNTGNGDAFQGGSASASSARLRAGQLGFEIELEESVANLYSDTTVDTLHAGWYQYVKLDSGSPTPTLGGLLFLISTAASTGGVWVVTASPTNNLGLCVGVNLLASWTPGNFWWMQIEGLANALFVASVTEAVVVGDPLFAVSDGGSPARGRVNNLADATAITAGNLGTYVAKATTIATQNARNVIHFTRQNIRLT